MPTASRCSCGAGDMPGSEIWSSAMLLLDRLVGGVDLGVEAVEEHQLPDELRGAGVVFLAVDRACDFVLKIIFFKAKARAQAVQPGKVLAAASRLELLAQLELLHEEIRRHLRVGLERHVDAVQLEKMAAALHRILERAVGLVHAGGPLQRRPALGVASV